jgi:hypothetical protein
MHVCVYICMCAYVNVGVYVYAHTRMFTGTVNKAPPAEMDVHVALPPAGTNGDMLSRRLFFSVLESVQNQHKAQEAFLRQQVCVRCTHFTEWYGHGKFEP